MDAIMQYDGSLVAFEGPRDTISTQLRLLPNSPNILIIPPLRYFMKEVDPEAPFNAQSYILAVHKACSDRADIARKFLRDSTPSNKRLVFMNGGTASAQLDCVSNISKHLTTGDFTKAERIFNRLVRNGVAGLRCQPRTAIDPKSSQAVTASPQPSEDGEELASDPVSEAMRAADALDLETAFLQTNDEIDLTTTTRPRSTSVPIYRAIDDIQNAAPFYVFGAQKWKRRSAHGLELPQSPRRSYTTQDSRKPIRRALDPAGSRMNELNIPTNPTSHGREENPRNRLSSTSVNLSSPRTFEFMSTPNTPAICEAFAVDIRPAATTVSHKKIKSVDRIYSSEVRNQDILLCSFPEPPRSRPQSTATSPVVYQQRSPLRSKFSCEIPRPTFSTPGRSVVRRNPPSPLKLHKPLQRPTTYVDRGTNPMNNYVDQGTTTELEPEPILAPQETDMADTASLDFEDSFEVDANEPYETILPMIENLVIVFKAENPDIQLEATIQAFRDGKYPVSISQSEAEIEEDSHRSSTPNLREPRAVPLISKRPTSYVQHAEVSPAYNMNPDEYDPFAYGEYLQPSKHNTNSHRPSTPPTPAQTPPLTTGKPQKCFHDFTTTNCRTAVCMQNSLRSILNIYFPPEDAGYHQFNFPLLPELSSLWKPVFRESDSGTVVHRKRKVDLILAIGAQQGVEKDFLSAISGSLEKLGTKPNGVTRSGRLDLRFLIASAMQAFTAQPLANQTQDNPFSNPLLLATLIIPHLETYMAAHSATRFLLLEYPPEHLATVLALQWLVGVDLLKIAGILCSEDIDSKMYPGGKIPPRMNAHLRMNSGLSKISTRSGATLLTPTGMKQTETPSFSKANFLITSSANESEIATLISTIWKILIDISTFYIPDGMAPKASVQIDRELKRESNGKPLAQTPLINTTQQYAPLTNAADLIGLQKQKRGGDGEVYTDSNPPPPPPKSRDKEPTRLEALKSSKGSITETIRSSRTARTVRSQRNKLRNMLGRETDVDSVTARVDTASAYQDNWDDEDYGFADEERKYMPLYGTQGGPRKGNSRKALKWLGLAT
ncbi:hypothetical protein F5Y13DRAFT_205028 [Hypoxylon sp. FL1857]|nr:hypothetical protein F5Y13DRAFT_205028 [Hypoxylon sp. FL1857]